MAVGRKQFCALNMAAYVLTTMLWKLHDAVSTGRLIYCQMEGRLGCVPSKYRQLKWPWPIKKFICSSSVVAFVTRWRFALRKF